MRLFLECYPCILRQALAAARLAGLSEDRAKDVMDTAMRLLADGGADSTPQRIVVALFESIRQTYFGDSPTFDPYAEIKRESNMLALKHLRRLQDMVSTSPSPLETAVKVAAAGNIIDFGAREYGTVDLEHEIDVIDALRFDIYDYRDLADMLSSAGSLLYIGDNAGEVVFDKVLIDRIKQQCPQTNVIFAVRDKPIINDATAVDAHVVGIDEVATVMSTGSACPGTSLDDASEEFGRVFDSADVVIAKGQGNFEGLSDVESPKLFALLRVKCERVAQWIGTRNGALVLRRQAR
jgi:uncharacterized protein with ATP-grasp and redox domains